VAHEISPRRGDGLRRKPDPEFKAMPRRSRRLEAARRPPPPNSRDLEDILLGSGENFDSIIVEIRAAPAATKPPSRRLPLYCPLSTPRPSREDRGNLLPPRRARRLTRKSPSLIVTNATASSLRIAPSRQRFPNTEPGPQSIRLRYRRHYAEPGGQVEIEGADRLEWGGGDAPGGAGPHVNNRSRLPPLVQRFRPDRSLKSNAIRTEPAQERRQRPMRVLRSRVLLCGIQSRPPQEPPTTAATLSASW